jgi:nitroimidazol reductase NimA-like FMN-containing flavoprotein (pyridoxamine 5'-phosphate oxidase superfamily)
VDRPPRPGDLTEIERDECVRLLQEAMFVRVGFIHEDAPDVLPVNHVVHDGAIYFRTAPGSKLGTAAADGPVAIEADDGDAATRVGWSVVAKGHASIVTDEAESEALLALPFEPWALPDTRTFWVRVDVEDIQGRRVVREGDA